MFKKLGLWQAGQAALRLLKKASIGKSDNSILFPRTEWNARAYNAEIKAAAVRYGWQESVRFRGSLSLRHGGVAFAAKELEGKIPLQEIASLLEMSITNYYRYRASNQERAMADEVGKEKRKSWLHTHRNVTASVSSTCQAKLRTLLKEDAIYTSSDSEEEERGNIKAGANPRGRVKEKSKEDINTGVRVTRPTLDRLKSWIIDPSKQSEQTRPAPELLRGWIIDPRKQSEQTKPAPELLRSWVIDPSRGKDTGPQRDAVLLESGIIQPPRKKSRSEHEKGYY
eukprot:GILI01037859.1.p1 GENE.GILI01037859.1~~GILI01037859.1.p1  ORF type:complete len:283 (+),score=-6.34 GILI01037859.1:573-1421(+)